MSKVVKQAETQLDSAIRAAVAAAISAGTLAEGELPAYTIAR